MPYDGEYAKYQTINRISETERVKQLLNRAKVSISDEERELIKPSKAPSREDNVAQLVLAIDGSNTEIDIKSDYPGAKIGYCTVACVLIDLRLVEKLESNRPFDPVKFRKTEKTATIDAALPSSNVVTRRQISAKSSFRDELFDLFANYTFDEEDKTTLLETYEELLKVKPTTNPAKCPYSDCDEILDIKSGHGNCGKCKRPIYSTDELRIHERFNEMGSNAEAISYVMQVWERIFLIHILRGFERKGLLKNLDKIAFFLDGPLAIFGPPAWLSSSIKKELKRVNSLVLAETDKDIILVGIEKSGGFVSHFEGPCQEFCVNS
ncbi:MAG: DNA double-strand break repair nuclease NurA [candidate division Zixibacteria bacterium]